MVTGWIDQGMWERAAEPDPAAVTITVVVVDQDLGSLAVARTPDGQLFVGADSPRRSAGG